ncbi:MAG TPA: hypothetical protein VJ840_09740 [Gemmatimonadaceae bacterium]|nr:hypothetical protein [Gemmatimonadaceae bacterium]
MYPGAPAANTGWNADAGPLVITPLDNSLDTVAVIVPEATDSTVSIVESMTAPVAGRAFDLFGRGGKIASAVRSSPLPPVDTSKQDCYGWPLAILSAKQAGWTVGFTSGRAQAIALDSIEGLPSADSASLAASLARAAATVPSASDPTFRGLPFRVRSAFTFRVDSVAVVIADVVRAVNEEANPRIEHLLIVAERPGSSSNYNVRYSNRTAGSEESTQASELQTAITVGESRRPVIVISIEYSDGKRLGLLERISGEWRATWRSAYTDC